jgi:hypothetical protein
VLMRCLFAPMLLGILSCPLLPQDGVSNLQTTLANPPGLRFELGTKQDRKTFRLGEVIEIEERYSVQGLGKYYLIGRPLEVEDGYYPKLTILPDEGLLDRVKNTGWVTAQPILIANCMGYGMSGGASGPCADCEGRYLLKKEPIRFPYVLNYRFAISAPGHYTLTAKAGNIAASGEPSADEHAIEISSTPLEIEIVEDRKWSSEQLHKAVASFESAQWDYSAEHWDQRKDETLSPEEFVRKSEMGKRMNDAAETIHFLDTEESLREAVRLYDGSPTLGGYSNPFWHAILESSHRELAVNLLAKRMLEENFVVSQDLLDVLTAMTLQQEQPEAFARDDNTSREQLSSRAREILREYVIALGGSLSAKDPAAREAAISAFEFYAGQKYCAEEPLVQEKIAKQFLHNALE